MKEYILYIVIGLAIAGVIAVYFITNKKIESLQNEVLSLNTNFSKLSSIINSNNRISNDDPFENTINNISPDYMGSSNIPLNINETNIANNTEQENLSREDESNVSSRGKLKTEIETLKKDIGNIEDLIEDSSGESNITEQDYGDPNIEQNGELYEEDLDRDAYNEQLMGIQTESLDEDIVNKIHNSIDQESVELNKNNSSEFDDLGNTEIENNSEFNNILDNKNKSLDKIEGEIQSLEDNLKDLDLNKISLEKNNSLEQNSVNIKNNTEETNNSVNNDSVIKPNIINIEKKSVPIKKLTDIEAQVIADKYSKKELSDICNELSISKSGTKKKMVYRISKNGYSFKNNSKSISNNISVN